MLGLARHRAGVTADTGRLVDNETVLQGAPSLPKAVKPSPEPFATIHNDTGLPETALSFRVAMGTCKLDQCRTDPFPMIHGAQVPVSGANTMPASQDTAEKPGLVGFMRLGHSADV